MSGAFGPLVTPDAVIDLLLQVARHETARLQHLADLERDKGLAPRTILDFKSIGRIGDFDGRQPQDVAPALMLFNAGTAGPPVLNENRVFDFRWTIGLEVTYVGVNRTDAQRGVAWYAMAAVQLLVQRTPRNGIVQQLHPQDMEPQPLGADQKVAQVRALLEAYVPDGLALNGPGVLDPDDLEPVDPYQPVVWPDVTDATAEIEREPIT